MRSLLFLLVAGALLGGCATRSAGLQSTSVEAAEATPEPIPPAPGAAIGAFGFDVSGMDRTVLPGDNFYEFANGTWARNTPIPADRSNYGMFTMLDDLSKERTRGIIEAQSANSGSKIGAAYASFMDEAAIDSKGIAAFDPWLGQIRGLSSRANYEELVAEAERMGISGPFGLYVGVDQKQNTRYAVTMVQSGLGMPDRDYYLSDDPKIAATKAKYLRHLTNMLTLAGEQNAEARAKALLDYETSIARVHWTRTESRDRTKTYNKMTLAELERSAPGFDFSQYLASSGIDEESIVVAQPSAVRAIARLVRSAPLAVLRDQLMIRSLDEYSSVLPSAFDEESFAFYGTALSGTPQQLPRWKRGVDFTTEALADEVSKLYVAEYFPPATKAAADELVRNVVAAMGRRIDALAWMAPETKARARAKLANFTTKIGYPEQWRDYSGLAVSRDDALGNAIRSARFEHDYAVGKLGEAVRRWEWGMTPMTVNAYANFGMSEIVFPAAILQPPFFDPDADAAVNYGGIGAVIGHEISHHFDDQGSKYNEQGLLADWWTERDVEAFSAATRKLVEQYNGYEPLPGMKIKGDFTLGENIGDLAGLTVAYDAWKTSLGGREAPVIDGFTGDQRFYLGWAQIWRRNYREENLRQRLITDPHSPSEQRVAIVRNLDPWYPAFSVQPGQGLYLPPEERVRVW